MIQFRVNALTSKVRIQLICLFGLSAGGIYIQPIFGTKLPKMFLKDTSDYDRSRVFETLRQEIFRHFEKVAEQFGVDEFGEPLHIAGVICLSESA